jgi:hypothetical protein
VSTAAQGFWVRDIFRTHHEHRTGMGLAIVPPGARGGAGPRYVSPTLGWTEQAANSTASKGVGAWDTQDVHVESLHCTCSDLVPFGSSGDFGSNRSALRTLVYVPPGRKCPPRAGHSRCDSARAVVARAKLIWARVKTAPAQRWLSNMIFVVGLIYAGTILFCVGATAWLLRAWTRRRYSHKSPSDLHYIVTGTALLLSAGIGVLVASQIVMVLGQIE